VDLCEPGLRLLARVVEPLLVVLCLEPLELGVQRGFFAQESVAPDIGFEDRVDGEGIIADDLGSNISRLFFGKGEINYTSCSTNRMVI
jgi:hypothetical protein